MGSWTMQSSVLCAQTTLEGQELGLLSGTESHLHRLQGL